jgi:uncharacterized protein
MSKTSLTEIAFGFGHENIQATHHATLEFTKDNNVSINGDCIIAVSVDRGLADLSVEFKKAMRQLGTTLTITVEVDGLSEQIQARGSPLLVLTNATEMVVRKSDYISDRTLAIHADKAAKDLSRELVAKLKNPKQKVKITFKVQVS